MFNSAIRGIWTFNNTLADNYQNQDFSSNSQPQYKNIQIYDIFKNKDVTRKGLLIKDSMGYNTSLTSGFQSGNQYILSISFWFYSSSAAGQIRHHVTQEWTPIYRPLIAKCDTTSENGIESITAGYGEFIVMEAGITTSQNAIMIALSGDNSTVTHQFESTPYSPGLHHVCIQYNGNGTSGECRIDIDGKRGISHFGPTTMSQTTADLTINTAGIGYLAHKGFLDAGIIADLVVQSRIINAVDAVRLGIDYITLSNIHGDFSFNGIAYDQPSTVTSNQIFVDGGNIFVSRSNGAIEKGFQPIWDTEFDYLTPRSLRLLNASKIDGTRNIGWSPDGLQVQGVSISI